MHWHQRGYCSPNTLPRPLPALQAARHCTRECICKTTHCVLNGTPVDDGFTNWALEAKKKGYISSLFGYTDTALDPRGVDPADERLRHYSEPLKGIDTFTPIKNDVSVLWMEHLRNKNHDLPDIPWENYSATKSGIEWEQGGETPLPLRIATEDHETHVMTDACIQWIEQQSSNSDQPWITHLSLLRPHPPFVAPEPYHARYDPAALDGVIRQATVEQESSQHAYLDYQLNRRKYFPAGNEKYLAPANEQTLRRQKASYYGLMTEVDDNLGRLFEALKASGNWDKTLIIFTSDHGEQMGDHWLLGKSGYFDQSYHIPLIIRDPRRQADNTRGTRIEAFTENVDIMPTMLDYIGQSAPGQCDGRSLIPFTLFGGTPRNWRNEVHWEFDFRELESQQIEQHLGLSPHQCTLNVIRDKRYKYVHFTALPPLFFDLERDPNEFINRADDPDYQRLVLEYAQKMLSWRMNHNERGLTDTFLSSDGVVTRQRPLYPEI